MHTDGPYFTPDLIGANGKLARLHKGGKKPPEPVAAPPPVRESNQQVAKAGETSRRDAALRAGMASTIKPKSLLGTYDEPGKRSLL